MGLVMGVKELELCYFWDLLTTVSQLLDPNPQSSCHHRGFFLQSSPKAHKSTSNTWHDYAFSPVSNGGNLSIYKSKIDKVSVDIHSV